MDNELIFLVVPLLVVFALGSTGFTRKGFYFSSKRRITGKRGKLIGTVFVVPSAAGVLTVFYLGSEDVRQALMILGVGIGLGVVWILSVRD